MFSLKKIRSRPNLVDRIQSYFKVAEQTNEKQTCRQQSDHFIYSTPALSVLFFSIISCSVLMALVFYYNDVLQKITM